MALQSETQTLQGRDFQNEVLESSQPVLVDFWADWCPPCKMLAPTIDQLADRYAGQVKGTKLDVDASPGLAAKYDISSIPTVILFHKGQIVERFVGLQPADVYVRALDALLD